jgi:hypothetical protein
VGIKIWVTCSMMVFFGHLNEVGFYPSLVRIFIYIAYLRLQLVFGCRFVCCGFPLALEIFSM